MNEPFFQKHNIHVQCRRDLSHPSLLHVTIQLPRNTPPNLILVLECLRAHDKELVRQMHRPTASANPTFDLVLGPGNYYLSVGIFNANWSTCLWWGDDLQFVNVPQPISLSPHQSVLAVAARYRYQQFLHHYAHREAKDMLRIIRPENNADTVSEGIAYGMLLAVAHEDLDVFEKLWRYAASYLNNHKLMAWHISASGHILDAGSASDADQDMAFALISAAERWHNPRYRAMGLRMIQAIRHWDTNQELLKPGDRWDDIPVINPSYFCPHYYTRFHHVTRDKWWARLSKSSLEWLNTLQHPDTGLWPDWHSMDETPSSAYPNNFSYDAVRIPWRLHWAFSEGLNIVFPMQQRIGRFFQEQGLANIRNSYILSGQALSREVSTAFIAAAAVSQQTLSPSQKAEDFTAYLLQWTPEGYYDAAIQVLVLSTLAGLLNAPTL